MATYDARSITCNRRASPRITYAKTIVKNPQLAQGLISLTTNPIEHVLPYLWISRTSFLSRFTYIYFEFQRTRRTTPSQSLIMSLSVSSFPEAPPKLVQEPKWQVTSSLKSSGRYLGTLLSKRSVPFLKGIGHLSKTHVKRSIIRQRAKVSRSLSIFKYHSSLSRSSIRSSTTVIDITPISNNDKYFPARGSDVDASSLNLTIEISLSPTISPVALSTPTAAKDIPAISPTDTVKAPYQPSVRSLVGDSAHAHGTVVQNPAKEREEVASDSEPHDPQHLDSEITTPLPISPSLTPQSHTVPVPSAEGRRRSHSVSAGVKTSATETVPPTRPRYKSETAIGLPRIATITPSDVPLSSEGKDSRRSENPILQPPVTDSTSTHTSDSTSTKTQHHQRRETISKRARARSGASSKSTGGNKAVESPPLSAHILNTRSAGSRLSANSHRSSQSTTPPPQPFSSSTTALVPKSSPEQLDHQLLQATPPPHLRPKTSDVAASESLRSRSPPSLVVVSPGSSDDASEQSPPPSSSVDKGRWLRLVAVPHAEAWDGEQQQQQQRRPRTAPEAVLMASW